MRVNSSLLTDFKPASSLRKPDLAQRIGETVTVPPSDFKATIIEGVKGVERQEQPANSIQAINSIDKQSVQNQANADGVQVTLSEAVNDPFSTEKPRDDDLVYSKPGQNGQIDEAAEEGSQDGSQDSPSDSPSDSADTQNASAQYPDLTAAEVEELKSLKERDAEVRRHEQAHAAAGGATTGAPTYTYTNGPDGRQYAVAGEVSVRFSSSSDPEKVIAEAQQIKRAATAPAEPSAQDYAVAREADQRIVQAQQELIDLALEAEQEQASATEASPRARGYDDQAVEKMQIGDTFHVVA